MYKAECLPPYIRSIVPAMTCMKWLVLGLCAWKRNICAAETHGYSEGHSVMNATFHLCKLA